VAYISEKFAEIYSVGAACSRTAVVLMSRLRSVCQMTCVSLRLIIHTRIIIMRGSR